MKKSAFGYVILYAVCFVCTGILPVRIGHASEEKKITVVFRLDDYSALSDTAMEVQIIEAFRKVKAPITISAVPFVCAGNVRDPSEQTPLPLPPEKIEILKSGSADGTIEVALHGYSHQTWSKKPLSEFSGLDFKKQLEKINKGKLFLEECVHAPVTTFVPPWNRYDTNTLKALEQTGFLTISSNRNGVATETCGLLFLPYTCSLSEVRKVVDEGRGSSDPMTMVVVLFHGYDFLEVNRSRGIISLEEFTSLLVWLSAQKDVRLLSAGNAAKICGGLSAHCFLAMKAEASIRGSFTQSMSLSSDSGEKAKQGWTR